MKALVWLVGLAACGFSVGGTSGDAGVHDDLPDMPPDELPDEVVPTRATDGLIGLWEFNESNGAMTVADTSGATSDGSLMVVTSPSIPAPIFANGSVTSVAPGSRIISKSNPPFSSLPMTSGGVTLELWVRPSVATHGTDTPRFIAGSAKNISQRNVAVLQRGNRWMALVRTTPSVDGGPELLSTSTVTASELTHIVLVADASTRALFVNGVLEASSAPSAPVGWDASSLFAFLDEPQHSRQWFGTLALVAMYDRALSADEISANRAAGP